jgi:hypothetical protein
MGGWNGLILRATYVTILLLLQMKSSKLSKPVIFTLISILDIVVFLLK